MVDGETGLYVHPKNPEELAAALLRLIENPALRERLGKAGRARVLEHFDQRKQVEELEGIYLGLLGAER